MRLNTAKGSQRSPYGSWRRYQASLRRRDVRARRRRRVLRGVVTFALLLAVSVAAYHFIWPVLRGSDGTLRFRADHEAAAHTGSTPAPWGGFERWSRHGVVDALRRNGVSRLPESGMEVVRDGHSYRIETSLRSNLQGYLDALMAKSIAVQAGVVVMEPCTGRVLAMSGKGAPPGVCPASGVVYPAASVFKIVTAAAAMEVCDMVPGSPLTYRGRKHTLYKYQLKEKRTKWTRTVSLKESFADSINPVFGKLGANHIGDGLLRAYATGFGYNQRFDFEFPVAASVAPVEDDGFFLAETASGFNKRTLMSPLHGAALVSAVLNDGILPEPVAISQVVRDDGLVVYAARLESAGQVAESRTCEAVREMMEETVSSGTARRYFTGRGLDPILRHLTIGGKTGSISNLAGDIRYDWFVGFGENAVGESVAVAVVVGHGELLGTRSMEYAGEALKKYFQKSGLEKP